MPYTKAQCRLFYAKKARGERVPKDFEKHCKPGKYKKAKSKKSAGK